MKKSGKTVSCTAGWALSAESIMVATAYAMQQNASEPQTHARSTAASVPRGKADPVGGAGDLLVRVIRLTRERQLQSQELLEELRRTREAESRSAALAERGRVARDMHDVLAHTLSGLAIQLEGARLMAKNRDVDGEVREAIERAHRLGAEGLGEARRAIGALRGDDLPGPEGLATLADGMRNQTGVPCELHVSGEPRELEPDARLAIYRTAQEALTNVRKHAAAERVELSLEYGEGASLVVQDHGNGDGRPAAVDGGGYGLTGMRERAELLGGRLSARRTEDGFRVELWLPA